MDALTDDPDGARRATQEADARKGARCCIRCGCTDHVACDGGCYWASVDPPICSRCA